MKLVSWNILHGAAIPPLPSAISAPDSSGLHNASLILKELGIEVLGLQEVDHRQQRSGDSAQLAIIAKSLASEYWAYAPTLIGTPGEAWRSLAQADTKIISSELKANEKTKNSEPSYGIGLISSIPVKHWHRLELGRSRIGLPLAVPAPETSVGKKAGVRFIYVRDEPRVALAAELKNGFTVIVTHLSFVPFVNYFQLVKIRRWSKSLPGVSIILGDLNLGWGLPVRGTHWRSLATTNTYPAWGPKIQFDYITAHLPTFGEREISTIEIPPLGISDHLPLGVEIF